MGTVATTATAIVSFPLLSPPVTATVTGTVDALSLHVLA